MSVTIKVIPDENRLDITVEGKLDLTAWRGVCDACRHPPANVQACIVDLTRVGRVFDSGIAILGLLYRRMRSLGTTVVFLCDDAVIRKRVATIASPLWHRPSLIA